MEPGLLILIGAVALVLWFAVARGRAALRAWREVEARAVEFPRLAPKVGLVHQALDPEALPSLVEGTMFLHQKGPPSARLTGSLDGLTVDVLETQYRTSGRFGRYLTQVGFLFTAPARRWPRFVLQPEVWALDPGDVDDSLKGCVQVDLGDEDFEAEWSLSTFPGEAVGPLSGPAFRRRLLELKKGGDAFIVESLGDRLLVWTDEEKTLQNETIELRLGAARRLRQVLDDALKG